MTTLPRIPTANTELCSTSAKAASGDGFSELPEAMTALRVGTASSSQTQSPNASAIRVIKGTDSGYGLMNPPQRDTSDSTPNTSTKAVFVDGARMESSWIEEDQASVFSRHSEASTTREPFNNLISQYTKPLFEFLGTPPNPKRNIRNIAMSLEVLGEERETAAHWVLIRCHKAVAKNVRSFFKQRNVEADFKPSEPTLYAPYLPILVHEDSHGAFVRSDILSASSLSKDVGISVDVPIDVPICGAPKVETLRRSEIKAEIRKTIPVATIGGLISVVSKDGNNYLFALTTGHFVDFDQYDEEEDEEDDDGDFYFSDDAE